MDIQNLIKHEISDFFASLGSPDVNDYIFSGDAECDLMRRILPLVTELQQRIEKAAAQLAELAAQEPVAWTDEEELRDVKQYGFGNLFPVAPVSPNADPYRVIELFTRPAPPAPVVVKLPEVETWRSVDAVRAQNAYRVLVRNAIETAGGSVADE